MSPTRPTPTSTKQPVTHVHCTTQQNNTGNGYIEGRELDHFLREFVASVSTNDLGADVSNRSSGFLYLFHSLALFYLSLLRYKVFLPLYVCEQQRFCAFFETSSQHTSLEIKNFNLFSFFGDSPQRPPLVWLNS